jgi:hypothetical protein
MVAEDNSMATMSAPAKLTQMDPPMNPAQIRLTRRSSAYWRVTIDNPPINVMGPVMVKQFQEVINALEADEQVRVVVFDSGLQNRSWRACFESLRRCFTNSET